MNQIQSSNAPADAAGNSNNTTVSDALGNTYPVISGVAENIQGKPIHWIDAKTVINLHSGFQEKLLCDGPTFTAGTACVYSCAFCFVPSQMRKSHHLHEISAKHEDVVIRRRNAVEIAKKQLHHANGKPKYMGDEEEGRMIYASPLVDVAATVDMCRETVEICKVILEATRWHIRLLSKSSFLPMIAESLSRWRGDAKDRVIYGVSTGTLDDGLAKAFEEGTALVSKRIKSLHRLQDEGYRTFGMICPSLPAPPESDYRGFSWNACAAIRADRCEHVWAEVLNVRGESTKRTCEALARAGYSNISEHVRRVSESRSSWEDYSRNTFLSHARNVPPEKLRFLQYVDKGNIDWWRQYEDKGAVLLGKLAHG